MDRMKLFHKIRKTRKKNEMKKQEQAKNMRLKCMEKLGETQERETFLQHDLTLF